MSNHNYPDDLTAKRLIVDIGKRIYARNFVAANDGNISCKVSEDTIWCTPTGVSKGFMTEDILVKMRLNGEILEGSCKPSSEVKMHLRVYQENPDVGAVVHAHPPIATSYAIAGIPLERPISTEGVLCVGDVPLAPYATPGTVEVPDSIAPFVNTHNGCLMANHGVLSWGKDLTQAWMRMEAIEQYALLYLHTYRLIGQAQELTKEQEADLIAIRNGSAVR